MRKSGKETPWEPKMVTGGQQFDSKFLKLCLEHNITPTKRQLSKYRNKKGILYKKCGGK